jgi:hypothetical protein
MLKQKDKNLVVAGVLCTFRFPLFGIMTLSEYATEDLLLSTF